MTILYKNHLLTTFILSPFFALAFSDSGSRLGFCGFISREIVASSPILGSTPLDTSLLDTPGHS